MRFGTSEVEASREAQATAETGSIAPTGTTLSTVCNGEIIIDEWNRLVILFEMSDHGRFDSTVEIRSWSGGVTEIGSRGNWRRRRQGKELRYGGGIRCLRTFGFDLTGRRCLLVVVIIFIFVIVVMVRGNGEGDQTSEKSNDGQGDGDAVRLTSLVSSSVSVQLEWFVDWYCVLWLGDISCRRKMEQR